MSTRPTSRRAIITHDSTRQQVRTIQEPHRMAYASALPLRPHQAQTGHHPAGILRHNGRCIAPGLISIDRARSCARRHGARLTTRACARCQRQQHTALKPTDVLVDELNAPKGLARNERATEIAAETSTPPGANALTPGRGHHECLESSCPQAAKTKRVPVYERRSLFGISALAIS